MSRTRIVLIVCFVAAFAAGVAVGVVVSRRPSSGRRGSWLSRELDLSEEQREQMLKIWSGAMDTLRRDHRDQRRKNREARNAAVQALLTAEQKKRYEKIQSDYEAKSAALGEARRKAFADAVWRTKENLTEEQRKRYEDILKKRPPHRRRWGGRRDRGGPPRSGSEQRPHPRSWGGRRERGSPPRIESGQRPPAE